MAENFRVPVEQATSPERDTSADRQRAFSSPFGALLEAEGADRSLGASTPTNIAILKDNFARDRDPYVTLNGCLSYYKFFCAFEDEAACAKGMARSLYAFPSTRPIDEHSSDAEIDDVIADFFCTGDDDPSWFDGCRSRLFHAAETGERSRRCGSRATGRSECFRDGCAQKMRCKTIGGVPQKGSCVWVSAECADAQDAESCRPKNTTKQTTNHEVNRYREGHALLRGD